MSYIDFASRITFFEFIQEEFKKQKFSTTLFKEELKVVKNGLNIDKLTSFLERYPKILDMFEAFYQLQRFTNVQYIHFLFDVAILNANDENKIINYAEKSILVFENGVKNEIFQQLFGDKSHTDSPTFYVYKLKRCIPNYVNKCLKDYDILHNHIKNSISTRLRIARYLIETLRADEYVIAVDIEKYLNLKRIPKDSKGIHGNFGKIKIRQIFHDAGVEDVSNLISSKMISATNPQLSEQYSTKVVYASEKSVENITVRKTGKQKVFDFILFINRTPAFLIETNFYSTSGTKIGINQGEYTDLAQDVQTSNEKLKTNLRFIWITDGNYWLSTEGEARYKNLKQNYFTDDIGIMNYNQFRMNLSKIIELSKR